MTMATCNGMVVSGGAVAHTGDCPVHGPNVPALLARIAELESDLACAREWRAEDDAAAERRGYERAVARLRDDARYTDWWSALPPTDPEHQYWQRGRVQLADYLDAVKGDTDD
jgi:hypothetical protein